MTSSLSAVDMSSAAGGEDLPSPFADIPALVHDHSYLPVHFDGLVDNALVYISGFVVRRAMKKLSCDVCRDRRCICHQGPELPPADFKKQWRSGDSIRRHSEGRQGSRVGHSSGISKHQTITAHQTVHCTEEDRVRGCVCARGEHRRTQYGIDSHHHTLLTLVVSLFFKLRLHHITKMTNLSLQSSNMRQKLNKTFSKGIGPSYVFWVIFLSLSSTVV